MAHTIIKWQCSLCKDIITSKSKERHCMDYCKCKKTAVDLEEHYCRILGKPELIEEKDDI